MLAMASARTRMYRLARSAKPDGVSDEKKRRPTVGSAAQRSTATMLSASSGLSTPVRDSRAARREMTAPPVVMIHSTASASTSAAGPTTAAVTRAITALILNVGRGRLDVDDRIRDLG